MWYKCREWAHSIVVTRVHGMDESRVRLPVGPQLKYHDIYIMI